MASTSSGLNKYLVLIIAISPCVNSAPLVSFNFAEKVLLENDFDVVVFLQTIGAILLHKVLERKYPGKFRPRHVSCRGFLLCAVAAAGEGIFFDIAVSLCYPI